MNVSAPVACQQLRRPIIYAGSVGLSLSLYAASVVGKHDTPARRKKCPSCGHFLLLWRFGDNDRHIPCQRSLNTGSSGALAATIGPCLLDRQRGVYSRVCPGVGHGPHGMGELEVKATRDDDPFRPLHSCPLRLDEASLQAAAGSRLRQTSAPKPID
jgi:hypothetical protein